jgi:hypothetical protein
MAYVIIIITNIQGWAIWPVPSPELQLLSPSFLRSPQLFSFLVGCSEMILKGFGFVAFFAGVKTSFFCIYLAFTPAKNATKPNPRMAYVQMEYISRIFKLFRMVSSPQDRIQMH